jgi:hypothetical protein
MSLRLPSPLRALCVAAFATSLVAGAAAAETFERISPDGGIPQIQFRHMRSNAAGDFVAVTSTRVYVGDRAAGTIAQIFAVDGNASFALGGSITVNPTTGGTETLRVDAEVVDTRLALNASGDFVVATNTRLYAGNTRTREIRQVATSGSFTQFQQVLINDAGQYVAVADEKIFGGQAASGDATLLLDEAVGYFSVLDLYQAFGTSVETVSGDRRVALNAAGQFVAMTASAVYAGRVTDTAAHLVYEERLLGFRHVTLNDDGTYLVVADKDVFRGSL